jgi:tetratricopeptide (TPR) repeat protein
MTYNPGWRVIFEVENGELVAQDGSYKFWTLPVGDNEFVNTDDAASLVFDTEDENAITLMYLGKYKFWKKGELKPGIARKLLNVIDSTGFDNIAAVYWDLKKNHPEKYDFSEWQLNALGYHFMNENDLEKALTLFKLNTEAFPNAFNTYDSYGEALLKQGKKEEGIEKYRKSIELNPGNEHGIKVLKNLGVSTDDLTIKVSIEHLTLLAGEYINTDDEEWKVVFEVVNEELVGKDGDYNFRLFPSGDNEFIIPDDGDSWIFDTKNENEIILVFSRKNKFKKVK